MTQEQKQRTVRDKVEEVVDDLPETQKRDTSDIDALLDEIDEVLDSDAQKEMERLSFRDKLRSLTFMGKRSNSPCGSPHMHVPADTVDDFLSTGLFKEGPPCVDC